MLFRSEQKGEGGKVELRAALDEFENAQSGITKEGGDLRVRPTERLLDVARRAVA
jgi:DUF1365 family protein